MPIDNAQHERAVAGSGKFIIGSRRN